MNNLILALHSLPRAGKDTLADYLVTKYGFVRAAFATELYREVARVFGVSVEQLQSNEWKTVPQPALTLERCNDMEYRRFLGRQGVSLYAQHTARFHLRFYATEYRRAKDAMYWVDQFDLATHAYKGPLVVTDVRFPNERNYLKERAQVQGMDFKLLEIKRDSSLKYTNEHVSDYRFPDNWIDLSVTNVEGFPLTMVQVATTFLDLKEIEHESR